MRFLLRMAFWLTVILALLPSGGSRPTPTINVSALEAMSAAKATVTDMGSFCGRQPDACSVGSQAAVAIGHRAQAGAKMLYDYFNEHFGSHETPEPRQMPRTARLSRFRPRALRSTRLSPADLAPGMARPAKPQGNAQRSAGLIGTVSASRWFHSAEQPDGVHRQRLQA